MTTQVSSELVDQSTLRSLRDLSDDDPGFLRSLIDDYLVDSAMIIEELRAHVKSGSAEWIARTAHSLKGSSLNVGAGKMAELARALETKGRTKDLSHVDLILEQIEKVYSLTVQEFNKVK